MRPLFQISGKNPTHRTSLNSFSMASLKRWSVCFSISFRMLSTPQAFLGSRTRSLSSNSCVMGKSKGFWFPLIDLSKLSSLLIVSFWLEFWISVGLYNSWKLVFHVSPSWMARISWFGLYNNFHFSQNLCEFIDFSISSNWFCKNCAFFRRESGFILF